jgi:hypothetical protein
MRSTRGRAVIFLLLISITSVHAASITVSIVQNEQAPAIAIDISRTIEDELFNDYYDAGHIVSNTDIRFDGSSFTQKNFGIKEAAFGFSDFLVTVYLEYGPGEIKDTEKKTTYAELRSLVWRVVQVNNSAILASDTIDVTKIKVTDFDPYKQSRLVADRVTDSTLKILAKASSGGNK